MNVISDSNFSAEDIHAIIDTQFQHMQKSLAKALAIQHGFIFFSELISQYDMYVKI